jgi:putative glutamine amidotransferase
MSQPLIALTGRRLGAKQDRWPYADAPALPLTYFDAVRAAGGIPVLFDAAPMSTAEIDAALARFDALILTGGPDVDPACYGEDTRPEVYGVDRAADDFEIALVKRAIDRDVRTLAICRGIQILNVALGGSLYQHMPHEPGVPAHGRPGEANGQREHDVQIEAGSNLAKVLGIDRASASCHHHQALDRLGDGLVVTARADDGIIEGVELDGAPLLAVQWHPEDTARIDAVQRRLFEWLTT